MLKRAELGPFPRPPTAHGGQVGNNIGRVGARHFPRLRGARVGEVQQVPRGAHAQPSRAEKVRGVLRGVVLVERHVIRPVVRVHPRTGKAMEGVSHQGVVRGHPRLSHHAVARVGQRESGTDDAFTDLVYERG